MMCATGWNVVPCKSSVTLHAESRHRPSGSAYIRTPACLSAIPESMMGCQFLRIRGRKAFSSVERVAPSDTNTKRDMAVYCNAQPGADLPSGDPKSSWKSWILGVLFALVVPSWKFKLGPLMRLKNEVETVVKTAEEIAEATESAAENLEGVADDVGNHLPEGKPKETTRIIEHLAQKIAEIAHLVDAAMGKVEAFEKKVDELVEDGEQAAPAEDVGGEVIDKEEPAGNQK